MLPWGFGWIVRGQAKTAGWVQGWAYTEASWSVATGLTLRIDAQR
jgi:hypothetical protein